MSETPYISNSKTKRGRSLISCLVLFFCLSLNIAFAQTTPANVAKNKPVSLISPTYESGTYCINRGYTKDKINDGNTRTLAYPGGMWWDNSAVTPNPWKYKLVDYEIDLQGNFDISQVKMHWGYFGAIVANTPDNPSWHGKPYIRGWRLSYLDKDGTWQIASEYPGITNIPGEEITTRDLNITASKLRITGWGYHWSGIYELEAFGEPHYEGTLVGPDGGEVVSKDGRSKLIIPRGALSEDKRVELNTISDSTLSSAIPQGSTLISAVECKPYGLEFNKSVQLIYNLSQAEVPGTKVELGLYNSSTGKINPTGHLSIISKTGYDVSFTLDHFSTYAALMNLTPQGVPIGGGVKIPLPDMFTGAFSHSVPLTVPPGRKGIQPSLGLTYRSSNPNSWVGVGFSLNPGYIIRSSRLGPPTYSDTQDTFYLVTDSGTTELVYLIDNIYQAKIESSFSKFYKQADDSWKVIGKDGSILLLGTNSNSKEIALKGTFAWYVTKTIDTNGNYISFDYQKIDSKPYLDEINYTGNEAGLSPTNTVEFYLESRSDISSSYISGSKVSVNKRLKEILVKVKGDLVWKYELEYTPSPDTNRSLLKSITQSGSDGKQLPKQTFTYQVSH